METTYIISPWFFYLINVVEGIDVVSIILTVAGILTTAAGTIIFFDNFDYGENDKDRKLGKQIIRISIPIVIVSVILIIFLPSKQTLIEIQVAKMATYENAKWTIDALKEFVDYIVEAAKALK